MTYENQLEKLNAELEAANNLEKTMNDERIAHYRAQVERIQSFFTDRGVTFALREVRREESYYNDGSFNFDLQFGETSNTWNSINIEVNVQDMFSLTVKRYSLPSRNANDKAGLDLTDTVKFYASLTQLMNVLNVEAEQLALCLTGYMKYESVQKSRMPFEIEQDIRMVQEQMRVNSLNFRVGSTLMVNSNGPSKRYRWTSWHKCIITKINQKSVQFVYVLKDGNNSGVQAIPFDYKYFTTVEAFEAEEAAKEARRTLRNY